MAHRQRPSGSHKCMISQHLTYNFKRHIIVTEASYHRALGNGKLSRVWSELVCSSYKIRRAQKIPPLGNLRIVKPTLSFHTSFHIFHFVANSSVITAGWPIAQFPWIFVLLKVSICIKSLQWCVLLQSSKDYSLSHFLSILFYAWLLSTRGSEIIKDSVWFIHLLLGFVQFPLMLAIILFHNIFFNFPSL